MPNKIIFENNIARVVEEKLLFECKTEDMLSQYLKHLPIKTRMMPRGVVYYERRQNGKSVIIVERCPQLTRIKYRDKHKNAEDPIIYKISLPFVYFAAQIIEDSAAPVGIVYPFCTKEPIKATEDTVFRLPMPNVYDTGDGNFCLGHIELREDRSMKNRIDSLMEQIMSSEWNSDLTFEFPRGIQNFEGWARESMSDPMLWRKLELHEHTFKNVIGVVEEVFKDQ